MRGRTVGIALLALVFAASSALAVPVGKNRFGGTDRTSLWSNGAAEAPGDPINDGDENRTIINFGTTDVYAEWNTNSPTPTRRTSGTNFGDQWSGNYGGMLYDVDVMGNESDLGGDNQPNGGDYLWFEPGGRYTSVSGTPSNTGEWTDTFTPSGSPTATSGDDYGGIFAIYPLSSGRIQFTGGPSDWSTGGNSLDPSMATEDEWANSGGSDALTDVQPLLVAALTPHPNPAGVGGYSQGNSPDNAVLFEGFSGTDSSEGSAWANIIGGTLADPNLVATNTFGPGLDIRLNFTSNLSADGSDGFQVSSNDPVQFETLPEPATISLLGLSVIGLAAVGYRRYS